MRARRRWVLALLVSLAGVAVAAVWLADPASYPYGQADLTRTGINQLIERVPAAVMLLGFAVAGTGLAGVALRGGGTRSGLRVASIGAAVEAAFFAFVMSDASVMSALGYAVALLAPLGVVALLVLVGRTWRPVGLGLAVLVLVGGAAAAATGVLAEAGGLIATYLRNLSEGLRTFGSRILWSWGMAAAAVVWASAALGSLRLRPSPRRGAEAAAGAWTAPESAKRWGRVVTIAAALAPVPYGLLRLTWLTPWPLGGPDGEFVISGGMPAPVRLQGLLFVPAVAAGVVLTLGLISRWGEVFPRWVPRLGGRPVPVMLAVVPGTAVAATITVAGPGMLVAPIHSGDLADAAISLFYFPYPVWGPLLGAAVLAYWLRRTATPAPDTPDTPLPEPEVSLPRAG